MKRRFSRKGIQQGERRRKGEEKINQLCFFSASLKPAVTKSIPSVLEKRFCSLRHPRRAPAELCEGVEWIIFCHSHQTMSCEAVMRLLLFSPFESETVRHFAFASAQPRFGDKFEFEFPRRPDRWLQINCVSSVETLREVWMRGDGFSPSNSTSKAIPLRRAKTEPSRRLVYWKVIVTEGKRFRRMAKKSGLRWIKAHYLSPQWNWTYQWLWGSLIASTSAVNLLHWRISWSTVS